VALTLVVLGDSIVYGWGVERGESYLAVLEGLINNNAPHDALRRVVKAGVPGDTVGQGCARYERDVAIHNPNMALIAFGLNDGALRRTVFDAQREEIWRAERSCWARAWRRLGRIIRRGRRAPGPVVRQDTPRVRPKVFCAALGDLIRRAKRAGARVGVLTLTPVALESRPQIETYARYSELIRQAARRYGALLVDVERGARDTFDPSVMLAEDGVHLTASGHRWLAEVVYHHLIKASDL